MEKNDFTLVVGEFDSRGGTSSRDLLLFLAALRSTYVQVVDFLLHNRGLYDKYSEYQGRMEGEELADLAQDVSRVLSERRFWAGTSSLTPTSSWDWAFKELPSQFDLAFSGISTNSPLKFIGVCTGLAVVALSIAVSLAGGKADLGAGQVFEVNSLIDAGIRLSAELRRWN